MSASEQYQIVLKSKGIPLSCLGVSDVALDRVDALLAVDLLRMASIPILGGDVYLKREGCIEIAYANWHTEPRQGEDHDSFAGRSCRESEAYIRRFPSSGAHPIFALVIDG
jgi:hypothetical protein